MSSAFRSVHPRGSLPGAVPPSNLGSGRLLATAAEVATVGGVSINKDGESGDKEQSCPLAGRQDYW